MSSLPTLPKTADIVIVGAGIIGMATAYHLARRGAGKNVVVLERGGVASGTTSVAGGGIRSQFSTEINLRFSIESVAFWRRFEEEVGYPVDFRETGFLFLAQTDEQAEQFKRNVALQNSMGVPSRLMTPADAAALVPGLYVDDIVIGTYHAGDGKATPSDATHAFAKRARDGGVRLFEGVEVTAIDTTGGRVRAVETTQGRIEAPIVLNAAGPWAGPLGKLAGVEVPVTPYRRATFVSEPFDGVPPDMPLIIDLFAGLSFHREGGGIQLSGRRDTQPGFDIYVDWDSLARSAALAAHRMPVLEGLRFGKRAWAGLYDISPDDHAIIGECPELPGFYLSCGYSGHGVQHAPAAGRLMAELLLDGKTTGIDIASLAPDRFRNGSQLREPLTVHSRATYG